MNLILIFGGIILTSIGLFFLILYLNLLTMGYNFWSFFQYIISIFEIWLIIIGVILIVIGMKGQNKNELLLRHKSKFSR